MAIKIFIENTEPHRGILVMTQGDILECKVSGGNYNYDTHTYEGYIKVKSIDFQMSPLSVTDIFKAIDFDNTEHAIEIMDKIEKILPEMKTEHIPLKDVVNGMLTSDVKVKVKDVVKDFVEEVTETKIENGSTKQSSKPEDEKIVPEKAEVSKTKANVSTKSQEKEKTKPLKQVIKDFKDLPNAIKNQEHQVKVEELKDVSTVKIASPEQKDEIPAWSGCMIVNTDDFFERGSVLVHTYENKDKVQEAILLNSIRLDGKAPTPLPLVFKKESVAKYFLESVIKHDRWKSNAAMFEIQSFDYLNRDCIVDKSLLVKDPKTFVNDMEKRAKD
jgi:hypothetical protein